MVTTLVRIIKYGLQSFWRNGLVSVATIIVMVLVLIVFEGLIIFNVLADTAVSSLEDKIDISVYFQTTASEDEILGIRKSLEGLKEVKSVEYISREKALEIFNEKNRDNPTVAQALEELETNPLLASLNIKAHNPEDFAIIAAYLENDNFKNLIGKITFKEKETRLAIERLTRLVDTVEKIVLALIAFLTLTASLVIFNTIRLAIHSDREEIGIMRLVGASNTFINGPYIVEAVIFGILAAILSLVITGPFISFASPYIKDFIPEMDLQNYFFGNLFGLFGYLLLFGILIGIISGAIATRRYLKI